MEQNLTSLTKLLAILFCIVMIPFSSPANDLKKAEDFIDKLGNSIIDIVDSSSDINQKHDELMELLKKSASIRTISRAALGTKWRSTTEVMKLQFSDAFSIYLVRKYGKQFGDFKGSKMVLERTVDAGKRGILVSSRFIMPGTSPISVQWQVWRDNGVLKLVDIIIEDISMLTMEREEIKNRLIANKGDLKGLITQLQSK